MGHTTAAAFARHTKGDAHIILCGRNRSTAEAIIASFSKCPRSQYKFVQSDVTMMRNVHTVTAGLLVTWLKLNYVFVTTGFVTLRGRDETSEGLDTKLALNYYTQWKFVYELMPLMRKAKDAGEDTQVMSVLAA